MGDLKEEGTRDQLQVLGGGGQTERALLGFKGIDMGSGCLDTCWGGDAWKGALRVNFSFGFSQEFQRQPPPWLLPLVLTALVRPAGVENPESKGDQGWAAWAPRWG